MSLSRGSAPDVYVLADMEGAFGITSMDQCVPGSALWKAARVRLTREVAAACQGAREGGAASVAVHDTHALGVNLLPSLLPGFATCKTGHYADPVPILGSIPAGCLVFMVAVHVGAGRAGHLPHTFRTRFRQVEIDERDVGETELYAALIEKVGGRVALATGDVSAMEEVLEVLPWCRTVAVPRQGEAAEAEATLAAIRQEAAAAVAGESDMLTYGYGGPVTMGARFFDEGEAVRHLRGPWARDGAWLKQSGPFEAVFRSFLDMAYLGRAAPFVSMILPVVRAASRWWLGERW